MKEISFTSNNIIALRNVSKQYKTAHSCVQVLRDVSFDLIERETVCVLGPSGSGKSTLLYILGLLTGPSTGQIFVGQEDITDLKEQALTQVRKEMIGFVFQAFHLLPRLSSLENVALPLLYRNVSKCEALEKARIALTNLGLEHRIQHLPSQLSGGEQQRVAIARAIVSNPKIILADEPTGNLDQHTGEQMLEILLELRKLGITFVIATHDLKIAERADRVLSIRDGILT